MGQASVEHLGGDPAATWSSPNAARAPARACSSAVMIAGTPSPRLNSIITLGPGSPREAHSVTVLGPQGF
jgi:hypothetical protein